jgi:hypothetical protein
MLTFLAVALSATVLAASEVDKERTLTRLARVAELYRDSALGFACQETIAYSGKTSGRLQLAYLFIRDENGRLRDFRTWKTGTTAKTRGQEVDLRDYHVPRFLESAYLFAFVFRSDRQPLYRFNVTGNPQGGGRGAIRIEFIPRNPIRKGLNDWAGYAIVDGETSQILEVEAYTPENWNRLVRRDMDVATANERDPRREDRPTYDIERVVTEFGFEKNGMRFPSHVEITTTRFTVVLGAIDDPLRDTRLQTVTQDYSRFEFFSVRSSEEIQRFVDGDGPLPVVN